MTVFAQVFELVKNSLRAVYDRFDDADDDPPPIRLVVAEGEEDITIKVRAAGAVCVAGSLLIACLVCCGGVALCSCSRTADVFLCCGEEAYVWLPGLNGSPHPRSALKTRPSVAPSICQRCVRSCRFSFLPPCRAARRCRTRAAASHAAASLRSGHTSTPLPSPRWRRWTRAAAAEAAAEAVATAPTMAPPCWPGEHNCASAARPASPGVEAGWDGLAGRVAGRRRHGARQWTCTALLSTLED